MNFTDSFNNFAASTFKTNADHGFEDDENPNKAEKIALMHSELSEALESVRKGEPQSEKIPGFTNTEEEFADAVIRIMNYGYRFNLKIAEAMIAKAEYNNKRPYKHGGKKF